MISHVVFDWNGTLLSDARLCYEITTDMLKEFFDYPAVDFASYQDLHEMPVKRYIQKLGISDELFEQHAYDSQRYFHDAYERLSKRCHTRRNARTTIKALHEKGISTIIHSNHTIPGIETQLNRLDLDRSFDVILANDEIHTSVRTGKQELLDRYIHECSLVPKDGDYRRYYRRSAYRQGAWSAHSVYHRRNAFKKAISRRSSRCCH